MAFTLRRKLTIILLATYWPTLFVLAHIPIPEEVQKAGVSDKGLHFLAYLMLVFLFWIALNPEHKVRWDKATVWRVLLIMIAYGVIDELLQGCVGRSCDGADLVVDAVGAVTGCLILTFLTLWPAAVIVVGATIFGLTNIAREELADIVPLANAMFHLFSYAVFTLLWIHSAAAPRARLSGTLSASKPRLKWFITALAPPAALLILVKSYSLARGSRFPIQDVILSVTGVFGAVGAYAALLFRKVANPPPSGADH